MQGEKRKIIHGKELDKNTVKLLENSYDWGWFVGMIEGEGTFQIRVQRVKENYHITPMFCISQTHNDKAINKIAALLKSNIKIHTHRTKLNAYVLTIHKLDDCILLANKLIQSPWYGNKKIVLHYWLEALILIKNKKHLTEDGFREIIKIKEKMREFSKRYISTYKYNFNFFLDKNRIGDGSNLWREKEIEVIEKIYPYQRVEETKQVLPRRSKRDIIQKAFKLGIKKIDKKRLKLNTKKIIEYYTNGLTINEIAQIMGTSHDPIFIRLRENNIKLRPPIRRSNELKEKVRDKYGSIFNQIQK